MKPVREICRGVEWDTMGNPPGIQGLIFDLDGVLIDSREAHRKAFEEVLAEFGGGAFDYDRFAGWRTTEAMRAALEEKLGAPPEETVVGQCARRKSARARELLSTRDHVAPECVATVTRLSEKYRLALASSGSRESVERFLVHTGLRARFLSVVTGDDVQHAKPDPEIFETSAAALGLRPEDCAVIEDSVAGIQAACAAGARAIGFGKQRGAALVSAGADCVVESLDELAGVL